MSTEDREALREQLAALVHDQWSRWMKYLFSHCTLVGDDWLLDRDDAMRWRRQMFALYGDLSEKEKKSDRVEADRVLAVLDTHIDRGVCNG